MQIFRLPGMAVHCPFNEQSRSVLHEGSAVANVAVHSEGSGDKVSEDTRHSNTKKNITADTARLATVAPFLWNYCLIYFVTTPRGGRSNGLHVLLVEAMGKLTHEGILTYTPPRLPVAPPLGLDPPPRAGFLPNSPKGGRIKG
jgi:hypothetical protein